MLISFSKLLDKYYKFFIAGLIVLILVVLLVVVSFINKAFLTKETQIPQTEQVAKEVPINSITNAVVEKVPEPVQQKKLPAGGIEFTYLNQDFIAFIFDVQAHDINFFYKDEAGSPYRSMNKVRSALAEQKLDLVFATNAGIFDQAWKPLGLFVTNGDTISPLNEAGGKGNFFLMPNGIFYITQQKEVGVLETSAFTELGIQAKFATQSGPILLQNGEMHAAFNKGSANKFIRSGVGILSSKQAVFLLSKEPVNFYDFASTFLEKLTCKDALYLDGAISKMYLPELNQYALEGEFAGMIGVTKPLELN